MVHVPHPTVFSVADVPESASRATRPLLLEGDAKPLVMLALVLHLLPVIEVGMAVTVVGGGEETYAQIHSDHLLWLGWVGKFYGAGDKQ